MLVVDLDPQGNATMGSGIDKRTLDPSVYDVLLESASIVEARRPSPKGGYDVVGANRELAGAEVELVGIERRDRRLRSALAAVDGTYDFVLIDCPPSLSLLTLNGLACAHGVVVPMQCEYFALEGLSDLVNTIKQVHANLNPQLQVIGILRVMFDARITLQAQVSEQLKAHFGDKVFDTVIPRNVRLAEAPSYGMPGLVFDPASKGALAFVDFAREMAARAEARSVRHEPPAGSDAPHEGVQPSGVRARAAEPGRGRGHQRQRAARAAAGSTAGWCGFRPARRSERAASRRSRRAGCRSTSGWRAVSRSTPRLACGPTSGSRRSPGRQELDRALADRGMESIDDTRVMVAPVDAEALSGVGGGDMLPAASFRNVDGDAFAGWIGGQRGSSPEACAAHAERLRRSPVRHRALRVVDAAGETIAGGQVALEGELAGLYDVSLRRGGARPRPGAGALRPAAAARRRRRCAGGLPAGRRGQRAGAPGLRTPRLRRRLRLPLPLAAGRVRPPGPQRPVLSSMPRWTFIALHRGAAGALAQVVEARHQQRPAVSLAKTNSSARLLSLQAWTSK